MSQPWQSTATSSATQTSRIRSSLSRPRRSTRTATETLSTESRLIEDRRGTGSSAGSTTTSLARPRIVVVQGAMSVRLSRGMAASRESTTTGRRPTSGSSHHHTSPRAGRGLTLTTLPPPLETRPDRPKHQAPERVLVVDGVGSVDLGGTMPVDSAASAWSKRAASVNGESVRRALAKRFSSTVVLTLVLAMPGLCHTYATTGCGIG